MQPRRVNGSSLLKTYKNKISSTFFSNYIVDQNFGKEENELLKKYWSEKLVIKVSKNLNNVNVAYES
jgi:hypothetical protein